MTGSKPDGEETQSQITGPLLTERPQGRGDAAALNPCAPAPFPLCTYTSSQLCVDAIIKKFRATYMVN